MPDTVPVASATYFGREIDYLEDLGAKLRNLQGFTTLAQELLQNADDVPAVTSFAFDVCDRALIVENDGKFTDCGHLELPECRWKVAAQNGSHRCDFHRFRLLAGADKRNEAGTTGAFGIGFISVYQVTDRPELISGRHWILDDSQPASQRIAQCPGCDKCRAPNPGTRFYLPWASDPSSVLRVKLRAEPTTPETPEKLLAELERSLPAALLFLHKLSKVEIRRNGRPVRCLERVRQADSILVTDGHSANDRVWHLLHGNFSHKAAELRALHPNRIESKRSSEVVIAIPESPLESGLLCATLPTQQHTGLPFHVNADFYPSEDRKRIIFDQDFQSEWNRAALASAAGTLSSSIAALPEFLGHQRLWSILARLQQISLDAEAGRSDKIYAQFWARLAPLLPAVQIVYTGQKVWQKPADVFYLQQESEMSALPILQQIGLSFVHEDLRAHQNLFTAKPIGIRTLAIQYLSETLKKLGLTKRFPIGEWPAWLNEPGALRSLWDEVDLLLNRRPLGAHQSHFTGTTVASVAEISLAISRDGALCPSNSVYRAQNSQTEQLFLRLDPDIPFASDATSNFSLFCSLCPVFGPTHAIGVLQKLGPETFAAAIASGSVSVPSIISWFVDHRSQILGDEKLKAALVALSIFPSAGAFHPLRSLSLPGDFTDPLQLAAILDVQVLPQHHDFLRELGIRNLSFSIYVSQHLIPALRRADLPSDKRRAAAFLLATRRSEISEEHNLQSALAPLPLVECANGEFRAAAEVYFPNQIVSEVLGSSVLQAVLPAAHETLFSELFRWLGVAKHPRYEDIVGHIKTLVASPPFPASLTSIRVIFGHLADRMQTVEPPSSLGPLRGLAWLPARKQNARWFTPAELYAEFQAYLFESQASFLDIDRATQNSSTKFLEFLGVKITPTVSHVVAHLLHCAAEEIRVNQEVYGFLNNKADDPAIAQLRGTRCLLLPDGHYIEPGVVFWSEHPFGRFRKQLGPELRKYNDLFQRLGIRETPTHQDALKVLSELSQEFGSHNHPLDEAVHAVNIACWQMLESALEKSIICSSDLAFLKESKCIPNAARLLTPPSWLFFEDRAGLAAKFEGFLSANAIPRPFGASKAMAAAGVRTLAAAVEVSMLECLNPVENPALKCRIQERRLQLARVLDAQADHANPTDKLALLDRVRFETVELLKISYRLTAFGHTLVSKPEDCPALFRTAENLLLFVAPSGRFPWASIARELALALNPDEEPGCIAPGIKEVLAAETFEEAKAVLDELGFSILESPPVAPAAGTESIADLGGQSAVPSSPPAPPKSPGSPGSTEDASSSGPAAPAPPPSNPAKPPPQDGASAGGPAPAGTGAGSADPAPGGGAHPAGSGGGPGPYAPRPRTPRRGKLRSYVVKDPTPSDEPPDAATQARRDAVNLAGIAKVEAFERSLGCVPRVMPQTHPGYDIESCGPNGTILRYIEVKSLSSHWGEDGIGLTATEFLNAQQLGDLYWLYVVERVEQEDAVIHCIQNPAGKVDQYFYDDGWQQAKEEDMSRFRPPEEM